MSKTASRTGVRASSSSSSVTKRVTASRLVWKRLQDPGTFFQTCWAPFVENARLSSAERYGRTTNLRLQKHWKRKRESPGEINVEGFGQDRHAQYRCLVGVVLFARLECLHRNAPDPSRQRQGPHPPNRDVWVRTVRNVSPSVRETMWKFRSNIVSMEFAFFVSFFFFFFFFFFFHFYIF